VEKLLKLEPNLTIEADNYLNINGFKVLFSNLLKQVAKKLVTNLINHIKANFEKKAINLFEKEI